MEATTKTELKALLEKLKNAANAVTALEALIGPDETTAAEPTEAAPAEAAPEA